MLMEDPESTLNGDADHWTSPTTGGNRNHRRTSSPTDGVGVHGAVPRWWGVAVVVRDLGW